MLATRRTDRIQGQRASTSYRAGELHHSGETPEILCFLRIPAHDRDRGKPRVGSRRTGHVGRGRRTLLKIERLHRRQGGSFLSRALAHAALAGAWRADAIRERLEATAPWGKWAPLARYLAKQKRPNEVTANFIDGIHFHAAFRPTFRLRVQIRKWPVKSPKPLPPRWPTPALATVGDVASFLGVTPEILSWFADLKGMQRFADDSPLWNYHYRWFAKESGGARLVEAPKGTLRDLQRKLLREFLVYIPPHECAHGFRRGRSTLTCATAHVGRDVVLRIDLEDFFASVTFAQVSATFRTAGYAEPVADSLAGMCTTRVPIRVVATRPVSGDPAAAWRQKRRLATPHLPTGSPTSPALANLAAYRLDCRLFAAAQAVGATYTRYADDLIFSGDGEFRRRVRRFSVLVAGIALDEGYRVNPRKTSIVGKSARQTVVGIVVNERAALPRSRFDQLRAMVHNCIVHGPSTQNREGRPDFRAWLVGTIAAATAIDPKRGGQLTTMLAQVVWER